jgi:hypothetical protein
VWPLLDESEDIVPVTTESQDEFLLSAYLYALCGELPLNMFTAEDARTAEVTQR